MGYREGKFPCWQDSLALQYPVYQNVFSTSWKTPSPGGGRRRAGGRDTPTGAGGLLPPPPSPTSPLSLCEGGEGGRGGGGAGGRCWAGQDRGWGPGFRRGRPDVGGASESVAPPPLLRCN